MRLLGRGLQLKIKKRCRDGVTCVVFIFLPCLEWQFEAKVGKVGMGLLV